LFFGGGIMGEAIAALQQELSGIINPSAISMDSFEGIIIMLLFLCCIYSLWQKASKAVAWCICGIVFFQCCYLLSFTGFDDIIPFSNFFKYDIFTSIAQCFAGTKVCDFLLWFDSFLIVSFRSMWDLLGGFFQSLYNIFGNLFDFAKGIGS
jgi:hypothetical protein